MLLLSLFLATLCFESRSPSVSGAPAKTGTTNTDRVRQTFLPETHTHTHFWQPVDKDVSQLAQKNPYRPEQVHVREYITSEEYILYASRDCTVGRQIPTEGHRREVNRKRAGLKYGKFMILQK